MRAERFQMQGYLGQMKACQLKMDINLFHRLQLEGCVNRDFILNVPGLNLMRILLTPMLKHNQDNKCTVHADGYRSLT